MSRKIIAFVAVISFSLVLAGSWLALGSPSSIAEVRFHNRLADAVAMLGSSLDLAALMPGEWELVCSAHCYDGGVFLKQYDRQFPAVSACQDGAWGLLFISSNGSYASAAGDCRSSSIDVQLDRCLPRSAAVLQRHPGNTMCPSFRNNAG